MNDAFVVTHCLSYSFAIQLCKQCEEDVRPAAPAV